MKAICRVVAEASRRWFGDRCARLAASLSYYAIFSFFPLALIAITGLGYVIGDDERVRHGIVWWLAPAGSPQLRQLLDDTLASMQHHRTARGVSAVVGFATLLLGASGVFSELDHAMNVIWRTPARRDAGVLRAVLVNVLARALSFAFVLAGALVLLSSLVLTTALTAIATSAENVLPAAWLWQTLESLASTALLALLFALMFRVLPRAHARWRDVAWGGVVTAVLFSIVKKLFAYYLAHVGSYAAYGAVGAVLGLLLWIYVTATIIFFGAEVAHVCAERSVTSCSAPQPS